MKISLKECKVQEMTFSIVNNDDREEDSFDLKTSQTFSEEEKKNLIYFLKSMLKIEILILTLKCYLYLNWMLI